MFQKLGGGLQRGSARSAQRPWTTFFPAVGCRWPPGIVVVRLWLHGQGVDGACSALAGRECRLRRGGAVPDSPLFPNDQGQVASKHVAFRMAIQGCGLWAALPVPPSESGGAGRPCCPGTRRRTPWRWPPNQGCGEPIQDQACGAQNFWT